MKNITVLLLLATIQLFIVSSVEAGKRAVFDVEFIEGDSITKVNEIITYDENRLRIDFPDANKEESDQAPYIMTVDGGETWIIGDKSKDRFYCSKMQTEEFFRSLGEQASDAMEFFNMTVKSPTIKQVLEEPGPEMQGYKTTHVRIETNASAYSWVLFVKFKYSIKVVDDLWFATELETHPVVKKWDNALTQSGNSSIDQLFAEYTAELQGPILKQASVIDITDVRKKETKTKKINSVIKSIEDVEADKLEEVFEMPECEKVDDDEVLEKAKDLLYGGKLLL